MIRGTLFALLFSLSFKAYSQLGYIVETLSDKINTQEFDEITPVVSIDGQTLYFTRVGSGDFNKTIWIDGQDASQNMSYHDYLWNLKNIYSEIAGKRIVDPIRCDYNQDIWYAETVEKHLDHLVHPGAPLNNALPNSICSLTPNPEAFVVINQFSKDGGMNKGFSVVKRNIDGTWNDPEPIHIDKYEVTSASVSLTMSSDGKILILSLPRKDSYGDNDLYVSFKIAENLWSEPKNLGAKVNSNMREVTPHLSADGKDLYFASNRYPSKGGLDLFFVSRLDDTWANWTEPRQFVTPINSEGDDSQPFFNTATGYLYFSSKRNGTSDIYRVKISPEMPQEVTVKGKIINAMTGKPVDGRVLFGDAGNAYYERYMETIEGNFFLRIKQGKSIKMTAHKPGFINHEVVLNYDRNVFFGESQEIILLVDSVAAGANISLNPIYFRRSTPIIQKDSYTELEYLADVMRRFPEINIRIEGHTDAQGEPDILVKLSEARANEVRKFLIRSKVNPKRVETIGYGAAKPVNMGTTEENRRLNRRVEVKITKLNYGL
jgi:outer membrane protein OmpA-like peptidoglycan-associated protein